MDAVALDVQTRDKAVKAKNLLKADLIPLEFYGRGVENQSLQVDYQTFRRLFRKTGSNTIIELKVEGKDSVNVLVHKVARHPIDDKIVHVDFINVRMGESIHTHVPVSFVGLAPAVKELAGTFMAHLNQINITCLPKDLIHSIEVDVSSLVDFQSFIRVKDLNVGEAITIEHNEGDVVCTVVAPRVEEESTTEVVAEGAEGEAAEGAEGESAESTEEGGE
ncbi:50S ribosomal protein L25 [Candidatus Gracilibacteria bacterium]|nr:50S ribosomal protein L25 [Candidatus Gracilibacteria bacterium]